MVNYYIYAKDYSISTARKMYYHNNGLNTLEQFKSDVNELNSALENEESKIVYLHWGHNCQEVSETKACNAYMEQDAQGYKTYPETIIQWIKKNTRRRYTHKIKLLYIITDGLIGRESFYKCFALNNEIENIKYEKLVFYAFYENIEHIDLTVAAAFVKKQCTIYRNNELFDETDISKDFDYDKITVDNFVTEKESLKSYIKYKFLTSQINHEKSLLEIIRLDKLKKRLNNVEMEENFPDTMDKDTFLREFKNTNWYKSFSNPPYNLKIDVQRSITKLMMYIFNEYKLFSFNEVLKFSRKFYNKVPEKSIEDINFTADQEIMFPDIILDNETGIPVILCTELNLLDKLIFKNSESTASFSKFNDMMECPLFLLEDPDLNDSMGYFYTLTVYKQLLEQTQLELRSRRPFQGGLVLMDTDEFDKYNDYILSAAYFNFKKVKYNIGLFYFVLWKICEKKQWMDENVVAQFKKYVLRRISTTTCKIGLSSLPLDPHVNCSLPTALWYCVEMSTIIFKEDPVRFPHERMRMYYSVADAMIEILSYLNYKLDLETINKRKDLMRYVNTLKTIPTRREKVLYMVEKIFKTVNGFLVCEIENQENIKMLNCLKLDHTKMLRDDVITEEVKLEDYVHFLHRVDDTGAQICEKTFWPCYMIDENNSYYTKLYKNSKKVVVSNVEGETVLTYEPVKQLDFSKILSVYLMYMNCVKKHNKYPTLNEYREYILKKKKFKNNLVTIFSPVVNKIIEKAFASYETIIKDVSVSKFIYTNSAFVNRVDRIKGENRVNFENDYKISEFLSNDERKVNFNKW